MTLFHVLCSMFHDEATGGFEPPYEVLQTPT